MNARFGYRSIGNPISIANAVTAGRIVFAVPILLVPAFSAAFYVCYLLGAATDMIDGDIARAAHQQTLFGAKLDTAADTVFVLAVLIRIAANATIPSWLWVWTAVIAGIKLINLISGFVLYRSFVAVHSVMNKITGGMLFFLPFIIGMNPPQQVMAVFVSSHVQQRPLPQFRRGIISGREKGSHKKTRNSHRGGRFHESHHTRCGPNAGRAMEGKL